MPSTNEEVAALPKMRQSAHDVKGVILFLPRTGLIVVPVNPRGRNDWDCVIIDGSRCRTEEGRESYPRGGYNIVVGDNELCTGVELEAGQVLAVSIQTKNGRNYEIPASDMNTAKGIVRANQDEGHSAHVLAELSFSALIDPYEAIS